LYGFKFRCLYNITDKKATAMITTCAACWSPCAFDVVAAPAVEDPVVEAVGSFAEVDVAFPVVAAEVEAEVLVVLVPLVRVPVVPVAVVVVVAPTMPHWDSGTFA